MKEERKKALESRIEIVKKAIIEANKLYQQYLVLGESATVDKYLELKKSINKFNNDKVIPISTPRRDEDEYESMYDTLKNHDKLYIRRAIKMMNKVLAKSGIYPEEMLTFRDELAESIIKKIEEFEQKCIKILSNVEFDEYRLCKQEIETYLSQFKRNELSQIKNVEFVDPEKPIAEAREKYKEKARIVIDSYKEALISLNDVYKQYKAKGSKATYEELESLYKNISGASNKRESLYHDKKIIAVAIEELKQEGYEIAHKLDSSFGSYILDEEYEQTALHFLTTYQSKVSEYLKKAYYFRDRDMERYVELKCEEMLKILKKVPMDEILKQDLMPAEVFVKVAVQQYNQQKVSNDKIKQGD